MVFEVLHQGTDLVLHDVALLARFRESGVALDVVISGIKLNRAERIAELDEFVVRGAVIVQQRLAAGAVEVDGGEGAWD